MQILTKSLVVAEEESLVFPKRSTESAIAEEFEGGSMPPIASRSSDDNHLSAGALAEFRAVGVAQHIQFADRVHAQQHAAGAAWLHVVLSGSGVLDSVEEEQILLRAIAGNREIVSRG